MGKKTTTKKYIDWFNKVNLVSYLKITSYLYKHHTLYVPSQVRFLLAPNMLNMVDAVGTPRVSFAGRVHIVEYIARKVHCWWVVVWIKQSCVKPKVVDCLFYLCNMSCIGYVT